MRRIMFVLSLILAMSVQSAAQASTWGLTSFSLGSGRSPVASGVNISATLGPIDKSAYGELTYQADQAWVVLAKNYGKEWSATLGGSTGYLQDAAWVGPYIVLGTPTYSKMKLSALLWPIAFIGDEPETWREDGVKNPESLLLGNFAQASFDIGRFRASYAWLDFLDMPANWLPGIAYTSPFMKMKNIDVSASLTRDTQAKSNMFYLGATLKLR